MKIIKLVMEFMVRTFFKVLFLFTGTPKLEKSLQKTIDLYKGDGFGELFALIRAWDAPYKPLDRIISKNANIIDLGSGDGLLANYLAISSPRRKVLGIELNADRARVSYRSVKNTTFKKGDILKVQLPKQVNTVILAHVLHHLPSRKKQEGLLQNISKKLKKGNKLVILEIDNKPLLKYIFSWLTDAITVPILFEGKLFTTQFFYRNKKTWKNLLESLDFQTSIKPIHHGMPFSHILIVATKK